MVTFWIDDWWGVALLRSGYGGYVLVDIIDIVIGAVSRVFEWPGNLEVAVCSIHSALLGTRLKTWNSVTRVIRAMNQNVMANLLDHGKILVISISHRTCQMHMLLRTVGYYREMVDPRGVQWKTRASPTRVTVRCGALHIARNK
jgi:hypothetical protein